MLELKLPALKPTALCVAIKELPQGQMFVCYSDRAIQDQTIYMLVGENDESRDIHAVPVLTSEHIAYGEVLDLPCFEQVTEVYPIKAYVSHLVLEEVK